MFSNWPEVVYLKTTRAEELAEAIVRDLIPRYGIMRSVQTDQGSTFESKLFKAVLQFLQIEKLRVCSLHPRSQGKVERFIRTLKDKISITAETAQSAWPDCIPFILLPYRSARHKTTSFSPSEIIYGRNLNLPEDLVRPPPPQSSSSPSDPLSYVNWLRNTLRDVHREVVDNTNHEAARYKERSDYNARPATFAPDTLVWLYTPTRKVGVTTKLTRPWSGPWKVISTLNDVVVRIEHATTRKKKVVHIERLAKYEGHASAHFIEVLSWPQ